MDLLQFVDKNPVFCILVGWLLVEGVVKIIKATKGE